MRTSGNNGRGKPLRHSTSAALLFLSALLMAMPVNASGVVVESAKTAFAVNRAGIREGDVLFSWERDPSPTTPQGGTGPFDSPFEARRVELQEAPRGPLRIRARRAGAERTFEIPAGEWGLAVRPILGTEELELYARGRTLLEGASPGEGLVLWRTLAQEWASRGDHREAAWLLGRLALHRPETERPEDLRDVYDRAIHEAALAGDGQARVQLRKSFARRLATTGRLREAAGVLAEVLAQQERLGQDLGLATTLNDLGDLSRQLGDLDRAQALLDRSRKILEREAPKSYPLAECLRNVAIVFFVTGDLAGGERAQIEALELLKETAPQSRAMAQVLTNQASLTFRRGDLEGAEELYRRAYDVQQQLGPEDSMASAILSNLASVARRRGNLLAAERFARRAVEIQERVASGSPNLAVMLAELGEVAIARGDLENAERWTQRALSLQDRIAADDPLAVTLLATLSWTMLERGDTAAAEGFSRRALDRLRRQRVRNLDVATGLKHLAGMKLRQQDLEASARLIREALGIEEELIPHSLAVADSLQILGELAAAEGDLEAAESHLSRALGIQRQGAPATLEEARSRHTLGMVYWRLDRPQRAYEHLSRAATILDAREGNVGSDYEILATMRARNHDLYRDYLQVLVDTGRPEEAFHVLERSRSRAFLEILAMRDLSFSADLPPDLDRERRLANAAYDEALRALIVAGLDLEDPKAIALRRRLAQTREQREEVQAEIRLVSPRFAAFASPQPLDLQAAKEALEVGTLLLSYAVAPERTYLFAVGPDLGEFAVYTLGAGERKLRKEVLRFRSFFHPGGSPASLELLAERLSEMLLAPAGEKIARAERLAVATDGPLLDLPFAALATPGLNEPFRFLVEAKPIVRINSVTSFSELKQRRRRGAVTSVIAFGDPIYPSLTAVSEELEPALRGVLESGFDLDPLPATRREVEEIGRLFPGVAQLYLGPEAIEERAKAATRRTAILHFASHVLVDERLPLESAIALTIPPRQGRAENGLLQAWEVFEQVRLDADLVTLSGCDTAGGRRLAGEGMVGLSRAFQYAGARTVLATLWKVTDESTSHLMGRFYRNLKEGASKDVALRRAQVDLLRGPRSTDYQHPFYWAAFHIIGDWR